jgi:hypothetical protein
MTTWPATALISVSRQSLGAIFVARFLITHPPRLSWLGLLPADVLATALPQESSGIMALPVQGKL